MRWDMAEATARREAERATGAAREATNADAAVARIGRLSRSATSGRLNTMVSCRQRFGNHQQIVGWSRDNATELSATTTRGKEKGKEMAQGGIADAPDPNRLSRRLLHLSAQTLAAISMHYSDQDTQSKADHARKLAHAQTRAPSLSPFRASHSLVSSLDLTITANKNTQPVCQILPGMSRPGEGEGNWGGCM